MRYKVQDTSALHKPTASATISKGRNRGSSIRLGGVSVATLVVTLGFLSLYSVVLVILGMLPALVAKIVDRDPSQSLSKIVSAFNIAGVALYVMRILASIGHANETALKVLTDPYTWLVIYSLCAGGWLISIFTPRIFVLASHIKAQIKVAELKSEINELMKEWGADISRGKGI